VADPSRTDRTLNQAGYSGAPSHDEPFRTATGPLPELPETSTVVVPGCSSNSQLNRSAEALGRGMGNAVAGVKSLPRQFDRLRSRIHLVSQSSESEDLTSMAGEVVGGWRDAVESGVAEAAVTANRYRSLLGDRTSRGMQELKWRSERRLFALRRDLRHRLDKVRRTSSERPVQFIARCAGTAFALGVVLRIRRSNHEYDYK
jgi:hypothetical protein